MMTPTLTNEAIDLVWTARERQLAKYSAAHDDEHTGEELVNAAQAMLSANDAEFAVEIWPWPLVPVPVRPMRMEQLAEAGAFIIAEMERLMRAEKKGVRA